MGFRLKLFGKNVIDFDSESRNSLENPNISLTDTEAIEQYFGITPNTINHDTALNLSAVWRAVNLLAGTIAYLPLHVYSRDDKDNGSVNRSHPVHILLQEPNSSDTKFKFVENLMTWLLLWGNFYGHIVRNQLYEPQYIDIIECNKVTVKKIKGQIYYYIEGQSDPIFSIDMIHVKGFGSGLIGKDPISIARESLEGGLIMQKSSNKLFKNGHIGDRYVSVPQQWKQDVYDRFKKSFEGNYAGWENGGRPPILEGGAELKPLNTSPENLQFLQSRKFSINEVARWFGIPPHKLYDLERSTNNNIEHQAIEFVTDTVMLYTERIEQELTRKLIKNKEKANTWIEFNLNGLLRGDLKTRAEYYNKASGGRPWMTPDEIRRLENAPALGGDAGELITPLNFKPAEDKKTE